MSRSLINLFLLLVLGFGLRLIAINQGLWLDEAAQVIESRQPWPAFWQSMEIDFHPPLYHLILRAWLLVAETEVWLRILSVFLGIAAIAGVWALGRILDLSAALLGSLLLAINPFHLYYSQEIRPYPLAATTYLLATILFVVWLKTGGKLALISWVIAGMLTVYSTYPTLSWLPAASLFLFLRRNSVSSALFKVGLLGIGLVGLGFLPWLPRLRVQLRQAAALRQELPGWETAVSPPATKAIGLTLAKFLAGPVRFQTLAWARTAYAVPVGFFLLLIIWQLKSGDQLTHLWLSFGALPFVLLGGLSFFLPVLEPKRVLFILPFLILGASDGLLKISQRYRRLSWPILVLLVVSSFGAISLYAYRPDFQREQWREAAAWVEETIKPDGAVIFSFSGPLAPWEWYADPSIEVVGAHQGFGASKEAIKTKVSPYLNKKKIIHFRYLAGLTDPGGSLAEFLQEQDFEIKKTVDFPGVGFVDLYQQNIDPVYD